MDYKIDSFFLDPDNDKLKFELLNLDGSQVFE